jgi:hypothetical protein
MLHQLLVPMLALTAGGKVSSLVGCSLVACAAPKSVAASAQAGHHWALVSCTHSSELMLLQFGWYPLWQGYHVWYSCC